jgi:hypothetical protein
MRAAVASLLIWFASCSDASRSGLGLACTKTIAAFCTPPPIQTYCTTYPPPSYVDCWRTVVDTNCGSYIAVTQIDIDTSSTAYYDRATGKLVAVISYNANGGGSTSCLAGPVGGFVVPQCSDGMNLCDAGTD